MYRKPQIGPPWGGWLDGLPSISAKPSSFKQITNFLIQRGRIQSLFAFNNLAPTLIGDPVLRMRSFLDAAGSWHTVALTASDFEVLSAGGAWVSITSPLLPFTPPATFPWTVEIFNNQLFFCAGPQTLMFWTGGNTSVIGNLNIPPTFATDFLVAGDVPGGCLFLGKLASRLIMLNTFENQWQFPRRVRWCGINNPTEWNILIDPSAGATDIPEVEDQITGWSVAYNVGYIYRNHGITSMTPTGNPSIPFLIQNYESGPKGVGVYTPGTLASYGSTSAFRAEDDIYLFEGGQISAIGTVAKKSILNDIESSTGQINSVIVGQIVPGIDYLAYWVLCPQPNGNTLIWIYHFDDQTWMRAQGTVLAGSNYFSCVDSIYTG